MGWALGGKAMGWAFGRWCEEELLVVAFPMLFSIANDKEA
ncbi:hypothetical protein CK203_109878 [Vitis vinifera]|uniref:Uncharacterized protein n=1 Tax=Vitis vinifera TaxID=29760 RepID=A0A438E4Z0_VITVI|nr:hypothetical protein CK203_109878 [Vitis vinifera]